MPDTQPPEDHSLASLLPPQPPTPPPGTPAVPRITPESAHEPLIRKGVAPAQPVREQSTTTLVTERARLTPRLLLQYLWEALLILLLPFTIATIIGLWQMARPVVESTGQNPSNFALEFTDIQIPTADGETLSAWDVKPQNASESAIIMLSGYGSDKSGILARTSFLARDHRLLYIDFRSFGESTGVYSTMGIKEIADARAALHYLRDKDVKHIGVYGFTMGGGVALRLAAEDPSIEAVVVEDAFANYRLVAEQPYKFLGPAKPIFSEIAALIGKLVGADFDGADPTRAAASVNVPALIVQSENNEYVPVAHMELLQAAMLKKETAEFWLHDGSTSVEARTLFAERLLKFFGDTL